MPTSYTPWSKLRRRMTMDTEDHTGRVGEYCSLLAGCIGLPEEKINSIRRQSRLHDVGKIHIPVGILNKTGRLTAEEFALMKAHTVMGARIIGDHRRLALARKLALYHHERWDGTGYPYGIRGEDIPIEARILSLADVYDALRNLRPYKPAHDHETACGIILCGDGRTSPDHFDPRCLWAFRRMAGAFDDIHRRYSPA